MTTLRKASTSYVNGAKKTDRAYFAPRAPTRAKEVPYSTTNAPKDSDSAPNEGRSKNDYVYKSTL